MVRPATYARRIALALGTICTLGAAALGAASSATASSSPATRAVQTHSTHSLLSSRELWATVDVCSPADQPNTVGIRGSMPGDGHDRDAMYMRFQLQYLEAKGNVWTSLSHGADSGFIEVGLAKMARQGGSSFQLVPPKGTGYTLRGLVTFQWRRGASIVHEVTRTTSAGHQSVAGADPAGYSAAQCTIG